MPTKHSLLALGFSLALLLPGKMARAADANDAVPGAVSGVEVPVPAGEENKAERRLYPGGRDEQNIEVQAVLPQPTRALATANSSSATTSQSQETDDERSEEPTPAAAPADDQPTD